MFANFATCEVTHKADKSNEKGNYLNSQFRFIIALCVLILCPCVTRCKVVFSVLTKNFRGCWVFLPQPDTKILKLFCSLLTILRKISLNSGIKREKLHKPNKKTYFCRMILKENILRELKRLNLTQKELAAILGVSSQSMQYYFRGNITLSKLTEIATALRVEPWELLKPNNNDITPQKCGTKLTYQTQIICPNCGKRITIKVE